jgi:hypothetical protein
MAFNWLSNLPSNLFGSRLRRSSDPFSNYGETGKFGDPFAGDDTTIDSYSASDSKQDPLEAMMERLFASQEQSTPASKRYQEHISNLPNRADYSPSKWRRLGAILAGIGSKNGYETASSIVNEPYRNALEDWSLRGKGLQESASIESDDAKARMTAIMNAYAQRRLADSADRTAREQARFNDARIADYERRGALYPAQIRNFDSQVAGRTSTGEYQKGMLELGRGGLDNSRANTRLRAQGLRQEQDRFNQNREDDFNYFSPKNVIGAIGAVNGITNAASGASRADTYSKQTVAPVSGSLEDIQKASMRQAVLAKMADDTKIEGTDATVGSIVKQYMDDKGNFDLASFAQEHPELYQQVLLNMQTLVQQYTTRVPRTGR